MDHTSLVAKTLLGCKLVVKSKMGITSGIIVETESYLAKDEASHGFKGKNKRNKSMFGPANKVYIYLIYGKHLCLNVVTGPKGVGEAVLIRAIEPVDGIELMKQRRKVKDLKDLANGPGKLCTALGITIDLDGSDLKKGPIKILKSKKRQNFEIKEAKRIGISKNTKALQLFYIKGNPFVSK